MGIRALNQTQYFKRYGIAIAAVATALLFMLALDPILELTKASYLLFFGAVTVSALYGGRNPGIAATLLSAICANYFFVDPQFTWTLNLADGLRMIFFIGQGLLIRGLVGAHGAGMWPMVALSLQTALGKAWAQPLPSSYRC